MADLAWLLEGWAVLVGQSEPAMQAGRDLLERWSEPHRHYHTGHHLAAVLGRLDELSPDARSEQRRQPEQRVRLAAWYHDAVYQPARTDNEERSAELARMTLPNLGIASTTTDEVVRLVLLTATHAPATGDSNGAALCDADLAILASSRNDYRRYAESVRLEYSHLDDSTWRAGRSIVLRSLLARPALFQTLAGRQRWETEARNNITTELAELAESGPKAADADRPSEA